MATTKIGIIGAGGIARQRHLPGFKALPDAEVVVVCNRTRETAALAAADFGIAHVVTDWHEVIEMPEVEAVVIAAPPYLHCQATVAALAAGKHVLCQARMAMNLAEAREMHTAAQAAPNLVTMLVPGPMILEAEPYLTKLLGEGFIGKPILVRLQALGSSFADPNAPLHWRQTPELSGVNTLTVGIYAEILRRLLGDTVRLSATGTISVPQRADLHTGAMRAVTYPDTLTVTAQMENGAQAVYEFSEVVRHPPGHRLEIYGDQGTLIYDVGSKMMYGARAGAANLQVLPIPDDLRGRWAVEEIFVAGIRAGAPVWPSFTDGVQYMTFTEAAGQSAAAGREVTLAAL
jgi:predicted dehydrogenase